VIILYYNGIFLRKRIFGFRNRKVTADHRLGNTGPEVTLLTCTREVLGSTLSRHVAVSCLDRATNAPLHLISHSAADAT
jgi:hypothetical protein